MWRSRFSRLHTTADVVFADAVVYYVAKGDGVPFMSTSYGGGRGYLKLSAEESRSVSLLIVPPDYADEAQAIVGGAWFERGQIRSPYGFDLLVFRRTP